MRVEDNLIEALRRYLKNESTRERNIRLISYFYGFGGHPWPTLEETAAESHGLASRERVRQILKSNFVDVVEVGDFPELLRFKELVNTRTFWPFSALEQAVWDENLADDFSIPGLFTLMRDIPIETSYGMYTSQLAPTSRATLSVPNFVIQASEVPKLRSLLKQAEKLPGKYGIAKLEYLSDLPEYEQYEAMLKSLLMSYPDTWTREKNDGFWFVVESRDNVLTNFSEKVFGVFDKCALDVLAETYYSALHSRTYDHPFPPSTMIGEYISSSPIYDCNGGLVRFNLPSGELTNIESAFVSYLRDHGEVSYPDAYDYLNGKKFTKPSIDKTVFKSPLAYTDKSQGHGSYIYGPVGEWR